MQYQHQQQNHLGPPATPQLFFSKSFGNQIGAVPQQRQLEKREQVSDLQVEQQQNPDDHDDSTSNYDNSPHDEDEDQSEEEQVGQDGVAKHKDEVASPENPLDKKPSSKSNSLLQKIQRRPQNFIPFQAPVANLISRKSAHYDMKYRRSNPRQQAPQRKPQRRVVFQPMHKSGADAALQGLRRRPLDAIRRSRAALRRARANAKPKILPRSESLDVNANFSACLLIKDDNDILNEWIAYHYHVIKMRRLIVAVDPLTYESPSPILQKWSQLTDLEIIEWNDDSYMPKEFLERGQVQTEFMQKESDFSYNMTTEALVEISNHRYRQRVFLMKCMRKLREMGSSWLVHIDTDEYVVASKLLRALTPPDLNVPPMEEPGSVLTLLQQVVNKTAEMVNYPCISMLRVLFGAVESRDAIIRDEQVVPAGFDPMQFETLRWRYHGRPHNRTVHGNPKVILDVAAIPSEYLERRHLVYSIHRPVRLFCQKNMDLTFSNYRKQPIAANHYLGSWERYSGRNDKRRSREVYDAKAMLKDGSDDGVRPWLRGFVQTMGLTLTQDLLGLGYVSSNHTTVMVKNTNTTAEDVIPVAIDEEKGRPVDDNDEDEEEEDSDDDSVDTHSNDDEEEEEEVDGPSSEDEPEDDQPKLVKNNINNDPIALLAEMER